MLTACNTTGQSWGVSLGNGAGFYNGGNGGAYYGGGNCGGGYYGGGSTVVVRPAYPQTLGYFVNPNSGWVTPVRTQYAPRPTVWAQQPY